ncbi:acetyl/propionyl/methylcrotonyl-CoA carboxylase subunit alpha [Frigoribacterium sp. 2-23]|uniref:acetyl/propionyl/methylcrotonyl-CoA carboxylase subunit alpha n=1 Tax=Frigoribacterium sp. 2-23 TaxID=3415006 RepID=UPI003C6EF154
MKKILIANRGEIAVRIARGCADYGVPSVAVFSRDDADALHVRVATEAWSLPGAEPGGLEPYLDIDALLDVARRSGADAVHPGYGFLAEEAEFARRVIDAGLVWIGPTPETIEVLGDKIRARAVAESVGAPLVVGTSGPVESVDEVSAFARRHGLPIAIKAAHGGGGRGMRVVRRLDEVADLYDSAIREAVASFGRGECFVEQYLDRPRHVEAQVLGDGEGGVVVVGTRDCSTQRRHQKLVEEAPAPFLSDEQRGQIVEAARAICSSVSYRGVGTVEFLIGQSGVVSFLEVNTRLQVEHTVTEATTGVDLVRQQLLVADGLPIEVHDHPDAVGHAIEFRLTAEDAGRGFLPAPATVTRLELPGGPGIRVDSGVVVGSPVPRRYDPLLLKLVVWGRDRDEALRRSRQALSELELDGPRTVLPFHRRLLDEPAFTAPEGVSSMHTRWVETECEWLDGLAETTPPEAPVTPPLQHTVIEIDGRRVALGLPAGILEAAAGVAVTTGAAATTDARGATAHTAPPSVSSVDTDEVPASVDVVAPVSGTIVSWSAEDGDAVAEGAPVVVIEAMKLETVVVAPGAGVLSRAHDVDAVVPAGTVLGTIAP